MKTSTATIMGVSALTAAVVGFGATAPSLATNLGFVSASSTDDSSTSGDDGTTEDSWGPGMHGRMGGPMGQGGMGAMHERMGDPGGHMAGHGEMMETVADTLGLSEDELITRLQDGATLGEIADAQGVDRQTLVDALMADHEERITEMLDQQMPMMRGGWDDDSDDDSDA